MTLVCSLLFFQTFIHCSSLPEGVLKLIGSAIRWEASRPTERDKGGGTAGPENGHLNGRMKSSRWRRALPGGPGCCRPAEMQSEPLLWVPHIPAWNYPAAWDCSASSRQNPQWRHIWNTKGYKIIHLIIMTPDEILPQQGQIPPGCLVGH